MQFFFAAAGLPRPQLSTPTPTLTQPEIVSTQPPSFRLKIAATTWISSFDPHVILTQRRRHILCIHQVHSGRFWRPQKVVSSFLLAKLTSDAFPSAAFPRFCGQYPLIMHELESNKRDSMSLKEPSSIEPSQYRTYNVLLGITQTLKLNIQDFRSIELKRTCLRGAKLGGLLRKECNEKVEVEPHVVRVWVVAVPRFDPNLTFLLRRFAYELLLKGAANSAPKEMKSDEVAGLGQRRPSRWHAASVMELFVRGFEPGDVFTSFQAWACIFAFHSGSHLGDRESGEGWLGGLRMAIVIVAVVDVPESLGVGLGCKKGRLARKKERTDALAGHGIGVCLSDVYGFRVVTYWDVDRLTCARTNGGKDGFNVQFSIMDASKRATFLERVATGVAS
ncbi:hypothetical protein C8R43DRAFT_1112583 [Mycena crocata]|nr:hypothetical protein C8R43DRAFT_1112583 [Mycena crocata]